VTVTELIGPNMATSGATYNDALLLLMRDLLPNGMLGIAIAGLLASFMAGMAANLSSFNTVFTYDIWQTYVRKDRPDAYYLNLGRVVTAAASILAIGTAFIAAQFANIMDLLQTLFSFFNAPLFATFILGMFWKRMTPHAGWSGLVFGTASAITVFAHRGERRGFAGHQAEARRGAGRPGLLAHAEVGPDVLEHG